MIGTLKRRYMVGAYYLCWMWFALFGMSLNLFCLPLLLVHRHSSVCGRAVRGIIRGLFVAWLGWFRTSRCLDVVWKGFDVPLQKGTVYIANHPTLLDATFLLARLPDAICVFKPALARSPAIGPAAIVAGYASSATGIDAIRDLAAQVTAGRSLLIFPEGTRTEQGVMLNPLKPGFALIAERARAPVRLISIRASSDLVPRGRPWWRPPDKLPARAELTLDQTWNYDPARPALVLTEEVRQRLCELLAPSQ